MTEPMKYDPQADMAQGYDAGADEWERAGGRLNILVAGNTGAGKSTLIKAFFGPDLTEPPKVGTGKSETMEPAFYSVPGKPFKILETRGFEAGGDEAVKTVDTIIKKMRADPNEAERLHMVWLCVEQSVGRFEAAHESFVSRLKANDVPIVIVITKSYDDAGALESAIRNMVGAGIPIVNVLAEEKASRAGAIPVHGLNHLLEKTSRLIPEVRRQALAAAQVVSWKYKDSQAAKVIASAVVKAGASAFIPVPGGQIVSLGAVQGKMMHDLDVLAGSTPRSFMHYAKMVGMSAARSGGTKLFQLAIAQAAKVFPGLGSGAGTAIGAGVGSAVTGALGYAYWNATKLAAKSGKVMTPDEFAHAYAEFRAKADAPSSKAA